MYRIDQYGKNVNGRDFVVGDIHGMLDKLYEFLDSVNFDYNNDRLFCVGDLIDRGKKSFEMLKLTYEKWFFSILGNHEVMLLTGHHSYAKEWFEKLTLPEQKECLDIIKNLPLAIELESNNGKIGIIHAQFPIQFNDWEEYKSYILTSDLSYDVKATHDKLGVIRDSLWSRKRIYYELKKNGIGHARKAYIKFIKDGLWNRSILYSLVSNKKTLPYLKKGIHLSWKILKDLFQRTIHPESYIKNITYTIHGHTPVKTPLLLGNQFFIDTGAVYGSRKNHIGTMTMIEINNDMKFHSLLINSNENQSIEKVNMI